MSKKQAIKLNESQLRNMIRQIIRESIEPGSISSGTMRAEDLIPRFMSKLFKENPEVARSLWQKYPRLGEALCDKNAGIQSDWWESDEAQEILNNDIFDAMNNMSPEGHYFGSHPGDGSDYGYWPNEEDNDDDYVPDEDDLAYADEVDMNPDLMLGYMMKKHGVYESKLDGIIKESINKVLKESIYADKIAEKMFRELNNPNTPIYKKNQIRQELISMGYIQMPNKQSQQTTQQHGGDIYSQTIQALNTNNYAFFNNGDGRQLQGVLSGLYRQGKITPDEYNKGMQWIGQGFQYSNAAGKYNW